MVRMLLVLGFTLFAVAAAPQAPVNPFAQSMADFKERVDRLHEAA